MGLLAYEKAVYLDELTDGAIEVILEHQPNKQAPLSFLPIFVLGGEFGRIPDDATAFGGGRVFATWSTSRSEHTRRISTTPTENG